MIRFIDATPNRSAASRLRGVYVPRRYHFLASLHLSSLRFTFSCKTHVYLVKNDKVVNFHGLYAAIDSFKLFTGEDTVPDYFPRILLCGINTLEMIDIPKYVVNGHTDTVRKEKLQSLYIPLRLTTVANIWYCP